MRYKRYKTTVSKIFDGIIEEDSEVKIIVTALKDKELTCSVQIEGEIMQDNVRIIKTDDDKFTWRMIKNKAILTRASSYMSIEQIEVNATTEITAILKPNPSRWALLDPEGEAD